MVTFSLSAAIDGEFGDYFLDSDLPITYGEASFRERILERTEGKRDPIGLVLTGGSARALAHIGVLEYLEENDIVPDFIVSNSMGSIIGMCYAAGLKPTQIAELVTVGELSNYFNLTIPLNGGFLEPASFKTLVKSVTGEDLRLEDLPIPVMVISDDLVTKREVRICEGNFADIMIASFAMPVYFPPQKFQGHLLIDGGVKSLAPIEAAYDFTDTVILSTTFYDLDTINLVNPITIVNGAFDVGKRQKAAGDLKNHDDYIWIRCNVEQYSFMAFNKAEEMAVLGYEAAKEQAEKLDRLPKSNGHEFDEIRAYYSTAIMRTRDNLYFFDRIESASASNILALGYVSNQEQEYTNYLRDTVDLGIQYKLRYKPVELTVTAGGAFDTRTKEQASASPALAMSFNVYPLQRLLLSIDMSSVWDNDGWVPSMYMRQGLNFKAYSDPGTVDVQVSEAFEYYNGQGEENDRYLLTTEVMGLFNMFWGTLNADFGLQTTNKTFDEMPRFYLQGGLRTRATWPYGFYTDLGVRMRGSVDGLSGVPLYFSDMYETNKIQAGSGYIVEGENLLTIFSLAAGWASPYEPTLAEFLIFQDMEIGAYFDILLNGPKFNFSTGVEIQNVFSLIGLVNVPLRMRFGYDSMTDSFCMSTIFSTKF